MANLERIESDNSSLENSVSEEQAKKKIVVSTWTMSRGMPHLFYWRDPNSYENDPWSTAEFKPDGDMKEAAKETVVEDLVFSGIEEELAKKSIRKIEMSGKVGFHFLDDDSNYSRRIVPIVFVETMPSVLQKLIKIDAHLLFPAWVINPRAGDNDPKSRSVENAFKKFASLKSTK